MKAISYGTVSARVTPLRGRQAGQGEVCVGTSAAAQIFPYATQHTLTVFSWSVERLLVLLNQVDRMSTVQRDGLGGVTSFRRLQRSQNSSNHLKTISFTHMLVTPLSLKPSARVVNKWSRH